jgi:2-amino-4-hydroxy-6-hydroxymethyldihydropteridine diphosphokinase
LALGSNLGDRHAIIQRAALRLCEEGVNELVISPFFETAPVGCTPDAPPFVNTAVIGSTSLSPQVLLSRCLLIEAEFGVRVAPVNGIYQDRHIDIDLLIYGDHRICDKDLVLPHPRMRERRFVLEPLAAIAPDWRISGTGRTVAEALMALG